MYEKCLKEVKETESFTQSDKQRNKHNIYLQTTPNEHKTQCASAS